MSWWGQRISCTSWFFLSTMWVPETELRSSAVVATPLPTEPSHRPLCSFQSQSLDPSGQDLATESLIRSTPSSAGLSIPTLYTLSPSTSIFKSLSHRILASPCEFPQSFLFNICSNVFYSCLLTFIPCATMRINNKQKTLLYCITTLGNYHQLVWLHNLLKQLHKHPSPLLLNVLLSHSEHTAFCCCFSVCIVHISS